MRDFVGTLAEAGCRTFIVHARNAWLQGPQSEGQPRGPAAALRRGLPPEGRISPLTFVLNGGLPSLDEAQAQLARVDGVMLGRTAYHDPWLLADVDHRLFGDEGPATSREEVVARMSAYLRREAARGTSPRHVVRHLLGLYQGVRGARQWRRELSDAAVLEREGAGALTYAAQRVAPSAVRRAA